MEYLQEYFRIDYDIKKFIKIKKDISKMIEIEDLRLKPVYFINIGVPHVIIFVDDIENINVNKIGIFIHFHKEFYPKGTNIYLVVGSIASTIISGIIKNLYTPISIHISSGAVLKVFFEKNIKNDNNKKCFFRK